MVNKRTNPGEIKDTVTRVDAINTAAEMTGAMGKLTRAFNSLLNDQKKLRRLTRTLIISLVLDLILTVGIGFLSVNNHTLNSRIEQTQDKACVAGNNIRKADKQLWVEVLALSKKPTTPQDQQKVTQFIAFVNKTFAPVKC